jgi:hypothetical protein
VPFRDLFLIVSEDEVVLERTLKRPNQQILKRTGPPTTPQSLLDFPGPRLLLEKAFYSGLGGVHVAEIVFVDEKKSDISLHSGPQHRSMSIPTLQKARQITSQFFRKLDHDVEIGKNSRGFFGSEETLLEEGEANVITENEKRV